MEMLGSIIASAKTIYQMCDKAQSNKKQCKRLKERVQLLMVPVNQLTTQRHKSQELEGVLGELLLVLDNARCWLVKYSQKGWWLKIMQAFRIKEEFGLISDRLRDAAESLQLVLNVEAREEFLRCFKENVWKKQNRKAVDEDLEQLSQDLRSNKVDSPSSALEDHNEKIAALLSQGICASWNITEIRATDLKRGELLTETPSHSLYRGEYHKGPVAIKVLKGQLNQNDDFVKKTFQAEIKTMKKFECVNILRLYGICIDNSKSEPCYSLVMEFCEKGTLRDLLNREKALSWMRRVHMVLDAARALYRLHQTELKAILHGSLSSSKFLVDGTYCLKLSEFELSKTESSMRRSSNSEKRKDGIKSAYIPPETVQSINAYDKRSEVYSLGVVFYEIASGKVPLEGLPAPEGNLDEIHQKLRAEVEAGLPSDCPAVLCDIIKKSLESDPNNRLTAGVIVDQLVFYLNQQDPVRAAVETTV
ncbi:mixed lineage kinase domain-like protein [Spea bombifrons]|uniref:mixed lineage kinase domain-like protein n=1 Tax=Spea bombifrons TaxID=233779 RepID=UPI00234A5E98|nr:mixed lineage kinase domain-like protein [Spea bombifrons]XP_053305492.1 mixed lineage kinase domain-like protein [Spea bombifrons]